MIRKPILSNIIFGLAIVVAAFALKRAAGFHLVSGDIPMRGFQMLMGLLIAFYGNAIPKTVPRIRADEDGRIQSLRRTCGWLLTVAGLGFAAVWASAPLSEAADWSVAVVATAIGLIAVCVLWTHMAQRGTGRSPG
jgi:4-hydroxybenzoate polyprenyltransferase